MAGVEFFLTLIETAGNQRTIFSTNKLRENVGASELIRRAGTEVVLAAIGWHDIPSSPTELARKLLDINQNKPIEGQTGDDAVEVLLATSGKALLLTRTRAKGAAIIEAVTAHIAAQAPAVVARGAIVPVNGWSPQGLATALRAVHERAEALGAALPAPDLRFQRLPFVEDCRSSGLPASRIDDPKGKTGDPLGREAVSRVTRCKRKVRQKAWVRVHAYFKGKHGICLDDSIDDLDERGFTWLGIVHADGNGLGEVFLRFADFAKPTSARDFIDKYRRFSLAIEQVALHATAEAIHATWPNRKRERAPVVPIVLGGDDLTIVCDGAGAVSFAAHYLRAFERWTGASLAGKLGAEGLGAILGDIIPEIAKERFEGKAGRFAAAAGIAIVKPHFPFHRAYQLAEALCSSAKIVKMRIRAGRVPNDMAFPCSALDYQVLFDTSGAHLARIRGRLEAPDGGRLTARPYVVTPFDELSGASIGADWAGRHHYCREDDGWSLRGAITALAERDRQDGEADVRPVLPRSQQHALHDALYLGRGAADERLVQIRHRYGDDGYWQRLLGSDDGKGGSLFFEDSLEDATMTRLLDAMELYDIEQQATPLGDKTRGGGVKTKGGGDDGAGR